MKRLALAGANRRAEVFQIVAAERNLSPVIVEKDFWVVWTLAQLFTLPDGVGEQLLFKGGTTLSKVYGLIRRFSEDIDLSVSRTFCGIVDDADPENALSNSQKKKRLDNIKETFPIVVQERILPPLRTAVTRELGNRGWSLVVTAPDILSFHYPSALAASLPYIQKAVRIELGGRSDDWPAEQRSVTSFVAESRPRLLQNAIVPVRVLAVDRTFWEKATILHDEYHRPTSKERGAHVSRHYADLAQIASDPEIGPRAIKNTALLARVAQHKHTFYRNNWSRYEEACPGTLRLVPPADAVPSLRSDYGQMRDMYFEDPCPFEVILHQLKAIEAEVNALPAALVAVDPTGETQSLP